MSAATSSPTPAVVELVISGPGFSDAERFELPSDADARAFARAVMEFALDPSAPRRRRAVSRPTAQA